MTTAEKIAHTPGPWAQSHREKPDGMWSTEVYDAKGETIATLAWYPVKHPSGVIGTARESNASLIASAPEMYAALKTLLLGFDLGIFQRNTDGDGDPAWAIRVFPYLKAVADAQQAIQKAEGTK